MALAHSLKVFARTDGEQISGYAFFVGGGRPVGAEWVATAAGKAVAEGQTGAEGEYAFAVPNTVSDDIAITVDVKDGHIASTRVASGRFLSQTIGKQQALTAETSATDASTAETSSKESTLPETPSPEAGFLFQESDDQLFCPTVIEDVAFGPRNLGLSEQEARQRAEQTLKQIGAWHLAERFSHRLSGGEKRLVCLAGLLAMHPDVLLLDEPTNGVDAENRQRLTAALKRYLGAIVLVSHDALFIKEISQQSLLLDSGQLKAISANSRLSEQVV